MLLGSIEDIGSSRRVGEEARVSDHVRPSSRIHKHTRALLPLFFFVFGNSADTWSDQFSSGSLGNGVTVQ